VDIFNDNKAEGEAQINLSKLLKMQAPNGGIPWFSGMSTNRYITQYIITGFGKLRHIGVLENFYGDATLLIKNGIEFLYKKIAEDYAQLLKNKTNLTDPTITSSQIQYLYMRSLFTDKPIADSISTAYKYYQQQAISNWHTFSPMLKGKIALAMYRTGDTATAFSIISSLKETAIINEDEGMYWKTNKSYNWFDAPIESQALIIDAFNIITQDSVLVDKMKLWLIRNKQTQDWGTTVA